MRWSPILDRWKMSRRERMHADMQWHKVYLWLPVKCQVWRDGKNTGERVTVCFETVEGRFVPPEGWDIDHPYVQWCYDERLLAKPYDPDSWEYRVESV